MREFHLNDIHARLGENSMTKANIDFCNQFAIVALDSFHNKSEVNFHFTIDGKEETITIKWDGSFPRSALKEKKDMANFGGVSIALFIMSVLNDFDHVTQSEIGSGNDYCFSKGKFDPENFFANVHYVEVSGILEERGSNTLNSRISYKHKQLDKPKIKVKPSSVIITLFKSPKSIKEIHAI